MNNSKLKKALILTGSSSIAIVLLLAIQLGWLNNLFAKITSVDIGASAPPVSMNQYAKAINDAMIAASESVNPTIVSISVLIESNRSMNFRGFGDLEEFFGFPFGRRDNDGEQEKNKKNYARAGGSGVIVTSDGYIVTNCHVVDNAVEDGITVITSDKKEYSAKLIGKDSLTDIAVIKIEAKDLTLVHFGNADELRPGQMVIAVGNPLGLNHTVTQGIISALGRGQFGNRGGGYAIENYIQTDAAINSGNSGGGLFDLNGSLIGINTLIASTSGGFQGYGFAIPVDIVKSTIQDLISIGKVNRGYMGAQVAELDDKFAKNLGLDKVEGVLIQDVNKKSPAEKAGIKQADVILEINGRKIISMGDLRSALAQYRAGDEIEVTLWRDKKSIKKKVTLESPDGDDVVYSGSNDDVDKKDNEPVSFEQFGFTIEPLTREHKIKFDVSYGIYVREVKRFSKAAERKLPSNCVIMKADQQEIKSTGQFKKILDDKESGETILLNIRIDSKNIMVVLEKP
ncbi:MAG: Do family serine endopeptidase [Bacteroidetes bacterium]|nr:Do family serine endopeptidase [Bacteroidota bacterium]